MYTFSGIDQKIHVESDTAVNADMAETQLIRTFNEIIENVNILEVSNRDETTFPENENPSELNAAQETEYDSDIRGQPNNTLKANAVESPCLTEGNQDVSETFSRLVTQHVLRFMDANRAEVVQRIVPLIIDIYRLGNIGDVHIMCAGEGCVVIMIRCRTYRGVSSLLTYIKSERFKVLLRGISMALERQLRVPVTLHPYIPEGSLRNLERFIGMFFLFPKCQAKYNNKYKLFHFFLDHIWQKNWPGTCEKKMKRNLLFLQLVICYIILKLKCKKNNRFHIPVV